MTILCDTFDTDPLQSCVKTNKSQFVTRIWCFKRKECPRIFVKGRKFICIWLTYIVSSHHFQVAYFQVAFANNPETLREEVSHVYLTIKQVDIPLFRWFPSSILESSQAGPGQGSAWIAQQPQMQQVQQGAACLWWSTGKDVSLYTPKRTELS